MTNDTLLAKQQETLSKLTHANTKLMSWHFKQEKAFANLRRRVSRTVARLNENTAMREQIVALSEKVEVLSEQVMTLSELNHNLTRQLHQAVTQLAPPEARDNVTHLKRSV
jgi:predicted RNase H-like nuclease (RuvC/YqgF family)